MALSDSNDQYDIRCLEVQIKSGGLVVLMGLRFSVVVANLLVGIAGFLGYTTYPQGGQPAPSPTFLAKQHAISDIQKQELLRGQTAQSINVIQLASEGEVGFAFATFNVDDHQQFASLIMDAKGYGMSTFSLAPDKQAPIQYTTLQQDGFEYITGAALKQQKISNVIITWSDGTAKTAAVQNGYFDYEHKVQSPADPHVQQVIAVTKTGEILRSSTTKS